MLSNFFTDKHIDMKSNFKIITIISFLFLALGACTKKIKTSSDGGSVGGSNGGSNTQVSTSSIRQPQCTTDRPLPSYINSSLDFVFNITCSNPNNSSLQFSCKDFSEGTLGTCSTQSGLRVEATLPSGTPTGSYVYQLKVEDPADNSVQMLEYLLKVDNVAPVVNSVVMNGTPTSTTAAIDYFAFDPTTPAPSSGLRTVCYKLLESSVDHTVEYQDITPSIRSQCLGSNSPNTLILTDLDPAEDYKVVFHALDRVDNGSVHTNSVISFTTQHTNPGTCTISGLPTYVRSTNNLEANFNCVPPSTGSLAPVCTLQGFDLGDPNCVGTSGTIDLSSAVAGTNEFCVKANSVSVPACQSFFVDTAIPTLAVNVSQVSHNTAHFEFTADDAVPSSGIKHFACAIENAQGQFFGGSNMTTQGNSLLTVLQYGNCAPCALNNPRVGCLDLNSSHLNSNSDYVLHIRVKDYADNESLITAHNFRTNPLAPVTCSVNNPFALTGDTTPTIDYSCETTSAATLSSATCSIKNVSLGTTVVSAPCVAGVNSFTPSTTIPVSSSFHIYKFEITATTNYGVTGGAYMDFSIDVVPPTIPAITSTPGAGTLTFSYASISDDRGVDSSTLQCLLIRDDNHSIALPSCTLNSVIATGLDRNHQYKLRITVRDQAGNVATRESSNGRPGQPTSIAPPQFTNLTNMTTPVRSVTSSSDVVCATSNTSAYCQVKNGNQIMVGYDDCSSPQVMNNSVLGYGQIQLTAKCVDDFDNNVESAEAQRSYIHACASKLAYSPNPTSCATCPSNSVPNSTFSGCDICASTQIADPNTGTCQACPSGFVASHALSSCYRWVPKADWINPSSFKVYERKGCKNTSNNDLANCPLEPGFAYLDASKLDEIKMRTDNRGNPICAAGYVLSGQNCVLPSWGAVYAAPSDSKYNQRRQCSHGTLCSNISGWNHFVRNNIKFAHRCINGGRPNGVDNCKPPIGYIDSGHHCSTQHAVVEPSARGSNGGMTRYNQLRNQGAPLREWKNPYYGDGSGLNYANEANTRKTSCWMNGFQTVISFQGNSWNSPENNAVFIWNAGTKRFDLKRGNQYNNWLSDITCGGRLHPSCRDEWQWIFRD